MNKEYKFKFINIFRHLHTINKHRFLVFKLSIKAGIPFQGLLHDLSKYSFVEFFEGVKYYQGNYSPITNCRKVKGYSNAWLHHKGRNKHHYEYWYDEGIDPSCIVMPYKYFVEMVCDTLSASMTYEGKKWTKDFQLGYYLKKHNKININEKIDKALIEVYSEIAKYGINKVVNKKKLSIIYNKYVN